MSFRIFSPAFASGLARKRHPAALTSAIATVSRPAPIVYCNISTAGERAWFSTKPPPAPGPSNKKSSYNPFSGMWTNYQEDKNKKNFKQQMEEIASVDQWNLSIYHDVLAKTTDSWTSKIPYLGSTTEVKNAKESHKIVESIMNVLGNGTTLDGLYNMSRLEKLKAADGAGVTVKRVEAEVLNFESATQTHNLISSLKSQGKEIPETEDQLRALMHANARKLVTKNQKERMQQTMMREMRRKLR